MKNRFFSYVYNLAEQKKNKKKIDKTEEYDKYIVRILLDLCYVNEVDGRMKSQY
jgi:hypothetical protein